MVILSSVAHLQACGSPFRATSFLVTALPRKKVGKGAGTSTELRHNGSSLTQSKQKTQQHQKSRKHF
jgi:hypothetical protein